MGILSIQAWTAPSGYKLFFFSLYFFLQYFTTILYGEKRPEVKIFIFLLFRQLNKRSLTRGAQSSNNNILKNKSFSPGNLMDTKHAISGGPWQRYSSNNWFKIFAWATHGQVGVSMITHCFSGKLGMEKGPLGAYPKLNIETTISKNY